MYPRSVPRKRPFAALNKMKMPAVFTAGIVHAINY